MSNIIQFPNRPKPVKAKNQRLNFDLERKRIVISASLVSIVFLVTLANNMIMKQNVATVAIHKMNSSRSIASISPEVTGERNKTWEKSLVTELSKTATRDIASIGQKPSVQDNFNFGVLEGKYVVDFQNGKLKSLKYLDGAQKVGSPKILGNKVSFLKANAHLLPVSFKSAVALGTEKLTDDRFLEKVSLVGKNNAAVGEVQFTMDVQGRMISMKVNSSK